MSKANSTPICVYKREILKMFRELWKLENQQMWCALYTFIKYYTREERGQHDKN